MQHGLFSHPNRFDIAQSAERPTRVVVRPRIVHVVILCVEQHVSHARVGLIHPDNVRARRKLLIFDADLFIRLVNFDSHQPQQIHHIGCFYNAGLIGRHHPRGRTFVRGLGDGAFALQIKVLQKAILVVRNKVHRQQNRGFLHVDVVAQRPFHTRLGRIRPEPIALRFRPDRAIESVRNTVAKGLVKAANRIVSIGDIEHVIRRPTIIEAMRPHAGHTSLGHLFNLVIGQQVPLVDDDGIKPGVVRAGAGRGVKKRHRLVQVVQNRRMVFKKGLHLIP